MPENKQYVVYKHTSPSGKVYIGITSQKPEYRWSNGMKYSDQPLFFAAIVKYGWINMEHEVLFEHLTYEEAADIETKLIEQFDSTNPSKGYNISRGASVFPFETFERKEMSKEAKSALKIKKAEATRKSWADPEVRERRMRGLVEVSKNPEYRRRVSEGLKKTLENTEIRKQRSEAMKKRMADPTFREASVNRAKEANKKPIRCCTTGEIYDSIVDASSKTGASVSSISKSLRGITKNAKFKWEYLDKNEGRCSG